MCKITLAFLLCCLTYGTAGAQGTGYLTRYVATTGSYTNTGLSWASPKASIQDAINDLRAYMAANNITTGGKVYVASGMYTPTESTEESGGTTRNLAFKMYSGIDVYGGFNADAPETDDPDADGTAGKLYAWQKRALATYDGNDGGTYASPAKGVPLKMKYKSILSGNLNSNRVSSLVWNETQQNYTYTYPGNTYHVVTFATNGYKADRHANALASSSMLNGFTIQYGYANNRSSDAHNHMDYGGGIYAVDKAKIEYCEIAYCTTTRNGGAVYCDGGGEISHSYLHHNQAIGIGIQYGLGGAVMIEGKGSVANSILANNYAGSGGAIAMDDDEKLGSGGTYDYRVSVRSCVVANNTSFSEAGGIYAVRGGVVYNTTICRNRCNGKGVIVGNVANGQAANIYAGEATRVYNSIIWGGSIGTADDSRNDVQYATGVTSDGMTRPNLSYVALSKHDETDWTYTLKKDVFGVSENNFKGAGDSGSPRYLALKAPSETAGVLADIDSDNYVAAYDWQPHFFSATAMAGVQLRDLPAEAGVNLGLPTELKDLVDDPYTPTATLGARTSELERPTPGVRTAYMEGTAVTGKVYTLFVDPERPSDMDTDKNGEYLNTGSSWDKPLQNLRNAIAVYRRLQAGEKYLDEEGNSIDWDPVANRYQILVKEGTLNATINKGENVLRAQSIWIPDDVAIYGSFSHELVGTATDRRSTVDYPSVISGKIISEGFSYSSATLVQLGNVSNTIFDGFRLTLANAVTRTAYTPDGKGAAIRIRNDKYLTDDGTLLTITDAEPKEMENNRIRNVVISNCGAYDGSALHITGASADKAVSANLENVIVHNNGTNFNADGNVDQSTAYSAMDNDGHTHSTIYVGKNAMLDMNHCNVLHNVGYGIYVDTGGTANITNSLFYVNLDRELGMATNFDPTGTNGPKLMDAIRTNGGTVTGEHNLFEEWADTQLEAYGKRVYNNDNSTASTTFPRFENPTRNCGITQSGGDVTYYGTTTSFMPGNLNPAVNAASFAGDHTTWGTDITGITRDYGGAPDIGARENYDKNDDGYNQPAYGTVIYVRDYNTYTYDADGNVTGKTEDLSTTHADGTPRDGSSWSNAINGNAQYEYTLYEKEFIPSIPQASTTEDPIYYKIGMLRDNKPGNTVYYAYNINASYLNSTATPEYGDDFVLISTGKENLYYIYDATKKKYCYYTDTSEGAGKVLLKEGTDGNTTWYLLLRNSQAEYRTYNIIPGTINNPSSESVSWNYHGGTGNNLGLYRGSDANSCWQFRSVNYEYYNYNENGLQYAVNTAWDRMKENASERTETIEQKYKNGSKYIKLTYNDVDKDDETEVWVGAGRYTKNDGFIIRNHVKVFGAFPNSGSPSKNDRHPQLNNDVAHSKENENIAVKDYESVLQPNEKRPDGITYRVLTHPAECRPTMGDSSDEPDDHHVYEGAEWDGFTMQNGSTGSVGGRNGGGGASIYENTVLRNIIIKGNQLLTGSNGAGRGGGIYCDGGIVENCYIMSNSTNCSAENYGGGIYMIKGTMFNTVITHNSIGSSAARGSGIFLESAKFYNNTLVNNTGGPTIGMWTASAESADLTVYNTIIMSGDQQILWRHDSSTPARFSHCFIQSTKDGSSITGTYDPDNCLTYFGKDAADVSPFALEDYADAVNSLDYRIRQKPDYNCVNEGTESIGNATLPDIDMDYADRVQDCQVDIGAYEYNGAYSIAPTTGTEGDANTAFYYVTQNGFGTSSATDPQNAACWQKLQKVLDAAGRYKYLNPTTKVVVKLAAFPVAEKGDIAGYTPLRSTEPSEGDARLYSIMVPRGVEVWGGYANYTTAADKTAFTDVTRNITENKTYFLGEYNTDNTYATAYHVVKFTDYIFDADGYPYTEEDADKIGNAGNSSCDRNTSYDSQNLLTLGGNANVTDRAIVDGIFISGGKADAASATASGINYDQYGGAAIITGYAGIRNCILEGNSAVEGGGAVYIEQNGVLSGSLLKNNSAAYGGAIYMEQVSDEVADKQVPDDMARVMTCTVVGNEATTAGGGIWFYNNTRVNSSVFWHNICADQANVSGQTGLKYKGQTQAFRIFPFAYSAVESIRLPGTDNIGVSSNINEGVRFDDEEFYALDDYSILCNVGMPHSLYKEFASNYGVAEKDFTNVDRVNEETATYIDIGARANINTTISTPDKPEDLLLRLYVSSPADVNFDLVKRMRLSTDPTYRQIGSSFAYPMQHFDDALSYIRNARLSEKAVEGTDNKLKHYAANLPFEIIISGGTFYPQINVYGEHSNSTANTFLIPEGVTIVGGQSCTRLSEEMMNNMNTEAAGGEQYFGQYRKAKGATHTYTHDITNNTERIEETSTAVSGGAAEPAIVMVPADVDTLRIHREKSDNNANGINEPWEFRNQTIVSGRVINANGNGINRAYHVLTAIADDRYTGELPMTDKSYKESYNILHPGTYNPDYQPDITSHEMGQPIEIDGLEIQDGYAYEYVKSDANKMETYNYYRGGGILVDGNWYHNDKNTDNTNTDNTTRKHGDQNHTVGYRDIPFYIRNCAFSNNEAGYGGAVSSNSSTYIFRSSFMQNAAMSGKGDEMEYDDTENGNGQVKKQIEYPGCGGALHITNRLYAFNTLFCNNEATDLNYNGGLHQFATQSNHNPSALYGGAGGCIFAGKTSEMALVNCNFVRNKSTLFPAIYTMNANTLDPENETGEGMVKYNRIINTIFWGNEATCESPFANTVINFARKGEEHEWSTSTVPAYPNVLPESQEELDNDFSPSVWFSSYEKGTAHSPLYSYDMRNSTYEIGYYIPKQLEAYATRSTDDGGLGVTGYTEQNCNIILNSDNSALDGPNFAAPSTNAGRNGYMASSDWSISRLNNIVDNGWGRMDQTITQSYDGNKIKYTAKFNKNESGDDYIGSGAYYAMHTKADIVFSNDDHPFKNRIIMGDGPDEVYMMQSGNGLRNIFRISHDPNPTHHQTYIDMGVYEYVHNELKPDVEGEVDILWVATEENLNNGEPDGSCWEQPTSDLQRAIETLLASRNGHHKEIRITNGEYSPVYTMGDDNLLTFYINTSKLNGESTTGTTDKPRDSQNVKSLTITGGWSKDWKMNDHSERDNEEYPAILKSVERSGVGTDKMNSVFRIEDARQWYGVKTSNQNATLDPEDGGAPATVIPITIEGLTFVNDNAMDLQTKNDSIGAGFYYGDQVYYLDGEDKTTDKPNGETLLCDPPTGDGPKLSLNRNIVKGSGSANSEDIAAAYLGKGGGKALIYNTLFHSNLGAPLSAYDTRVINCTFAMNSGAARLFDSNDNKDNCCMIHNSVFWRNGTGVKEGIEEAGYGAQFHYSEYEGTAQSPLKGKGNGTASNFTYNAVTDPSYYNETDKKEQTDSEDEMHNIGLSLDNNDAIYGPNFTNAGADMEARDFHLQPSVRLMNTGDNDVYGSVVGINPTREYRKVVTLNDDNTFGIITTYNWYDKEGKVQSSSEETATQPFSVNMKEGTYNGFEADLASRRRVIAVTIDRGAYEFQDVLSRVIYVDPSHSEGNGSAWDKPYTSLQRAIDLVAVYYDTYKKDAYVFSKVGRTNESLILRDGVRLYGSIPNSYSKAAERNETIRISPEQSGDEESDPSGIAACWKEDNQKLAAYERQIMDDRGGMAFQPKDAPERTIVNGLQNTRGEYLGTTLVDGVDIHGGTNEGTYDITSPVIDLNSSTARIVIRNCIVRDNHVSGTGTEGIPVARIKGDGATLLYNVLLQNNKGGDGSAVLDLGKNVYVLNTTNISEEGNTVKGEGNLISSIFWNMKDKTTGIDGTPTKDVNNNTADNGYPFSTYISDSPIYAGYPLATAQLEENSPHIDMAKEGDYAGIIPSELQGFVNYNTDRDIMGNPRRIGTDDGIIAGGADKVDRGCFETWRAGSDYTEADPASAKSVAMVAGIMNVSTKIDLAGSDDTEDFRSTYACYPQDGSVVYIMPGSKLILGEMFMDGDTPSNPLYSVGDNGYIFRPGYMLVKSGGSLYGQGCEVDARYIAVEKFYSNGRENGMAYNHMTALPYVFDYADTREVRYDTDNDKRHLSLSETEGMLKDYDAPKRADWQFDDFRTTNSNLWKDRAQTIAEANEGLLFRPSINEGESALLRFTAQGMDLDDYIYTESGTQWYKTVQLTQYDDNGSTGGGADFTEKYNMGWNCIGVPYLQGEYITGDRKEISGLSYNRAEITAAQVLDAHTETASPYQLHTPHTLWLYHNDTDKWEDKESYKEGVYMMTGEGVFTQTASVSKDESVTFSLPLWFREVENTPAMRHIPGTRTGGQSEIEEMVGGYRVYSTTGTIHVEGLTGNEHVTIHDTAGIIHASGRNVTGTMSHHAQRGTYIVRINNRPYKLAVK